MSGNLDLKELDGGTINALKKLMPANFELSVDSVDGIVIHSIATDLYYQLVDLEKLLNAELSSNHYSLFVAGTAGGYIGQVDNLTLTTVEDLVSKAVVLIRDFEQGRHKPIDLTFLDASLEDDVLTPEQRSIFAQYEN